MPIRNIMQDENQWKLELLAEALNAADPKGKWTIKAGWLRYETSDPISHRASADLRTLANGAWLMLEQMVLTLGTEFFDPATEDAMPVLPLSGEY